MRPELDMLSSGECLEASTVDLRLGRDALAELGLGEDPSVRLLRSLYELEAEAYDGGLDFLADLIGVAALAMAEEQKRRS